MPKRSKGRGVIANVYSSYMFKEKDPIIDAMRTKVQNSKLSYKKIGEASGVSPSTLHGWFHKNVRRPKFATVAAVGGSLGAKGVLFNGGRPKLI